MNQNALSANCSSLINAFIPTNLEPFYQQVRQQLAQMKLAGAEATVMFIHWGNEYQTSPNAIQQEIAQQLCDMGFDVIVQPHHPRPQNRLRLLHRQRRFQPAHCRNEPENRPHRGRNAVLLHAEQVC